MNNTDNKIIESQIAVLLLYIFSLLLSVYLLYRSKRDLDNPSSIVLFNRILLVIVYLLFLWIAAESYEESNNKIDAIGVISAVIAVIPPAILLYLYIIVKVYHIDGYKNPNL